MAAQIWTVVERDFDGATMPWAGTWATLDEAKTEVVRQMAEMYGDESIHDIEQELLLDDGESTQFPNGKAILWHSASDESRYCFVQNVATEEQA